MIITAPSLPQSFPLGAFITIRLIYMLSFSDQDRGLAGTQGKLRGD